MTSSWCTGHDLDKAIDKTVRIVAGLTTGLKVSPQSTPTCCDRPSHTRQALYRSRLPSDLNLCLKSHMLGMTFIFGVRGTNTQVPFLISALYSFVMAVYHSGVDRAWIGVLGTGMMEMVFADVLRFRLFLCLVIPLMDRVCMVREGGGGGFVCVVWFGTEAVVICGSIVAKVPEAGLLIVSLEQVCEVGGWAGGALGRRL